MKRKIGLLVILLLILCGMLLAGTKKGYHKDVYSEHYVPVEEVQDELSFSIYKEMDWEQILLQKQEYLTKKAASEILEFLGLKDYIQLPEKSENAALDRGEWNAVYTEILAYLDDEKTVTTQDLLLMDVIESDAFWSQMRGIIHQSLDNIFSQHGIITDCICWMVNVLELRESVKRKQRYIILISRLSKMEHLLFYPVVQNMRLQWMHRKKK